MECAAERAAPMSIGLTAMKCLCSTGEGGKIGGQLLQPFDPGYLLCSVFWPGERKIRCGILHESSAFQQEELDEVLIVVEGSVWHVATHARTGLKAETELSHDRRHWVGCQRRLDSRPACRQHKGAWRQDSNRHRRALATQSAFKLPLRARQML